MQELARRDLIAFAKRLMPGWQPARHLEFIARKLMALEAGEIRKAILAFLSVMESRSSHRSYLAHGARGASEAPDHSMASYADSLATKHSRVAKHLIEDDKYPFLTAKLSTDSTDVNDSMSHRAAGCELSQLAR